MPCFFIGGKRMKKEQIDKLNEIRARKINRELNDDTIRTDYGVPGMKWGERKEETSGKLSSESAEKAVNDYVNAEKECDEAMAAYNDYEKELNDEKNDVYRSECEKAGLSRL